jgi:hypothetical protein
MPIYTPTLWRDHIVDVNGNIVQQGTSLSAGNFNKIENGIADHGKDYVAHPGYGALTGAANTYAITLSPAATAYVDGMAVAVKVNVTNTGASTINVNGLGAKSIKRTNGDNVAANMLVAGSIYTLRYNATSGNFILQGEGGSGVNKVQRGIATMNSQTQTVTISSVDINRSVIIAKVYLAGANNGTGYVRAYFLSGSQIFFEAGTSATGSEIHWQVIEFSNVKSHQSGNFTSTTGTHNVVITPVSAKAILVWTVCYYDGSNNNQNYTSYAASIDSNLSGITFKHGWTTDKRVAWTVVDFD